MLRLLFKRFLNVVKWFAIGSVLLVLLFRVVPPPFTALMVERKVESWFDGEPIDLQRSWVPWDEISDDLKVAVMAGEADVRADVMEQRREFEPLPLAIAQAVDFPRLVEDRER